MNVIRTRNVTLECSATGFPAPSITWQHNRTIISETSRVRISSTASYFQTTSTLTVTMSMTNDSGRYFCTATSSVTVFDSVNSTEALVLVQGQGKLFFNINYSQKIALVYLDISVNLCYTLVLLFVLF